MKELSGRHFFKEVKKRSKAHFNPNPNEVQTFVINQILQEMLVRAVNSKSWGELAIRYRGGEIVGVENKVTVEIC